MVRDNPNAIDPQMQSAQHIREAIHAAGLTPEAVGKASHGTLQSLVAAASGLLSRRQEYGIAAKNLRKNLINLDLPPKLQAAVAKDANALAIPMQAACHISEVAAALDITADRLRQSLQAILAAPRNPGVGRLLIFASRQRHFRMLGPPIARMLGRHQRQQNRCLLSPMHPAKLRP